MQNGTVLITGMSGFIGSYIARELRDSYNVAGTFHNNPTSIAGCHFVAMDITDETDVNRVVDEVKPQAVIHSAAARNIDFCESNREAADRLNVLATRYVARAAARVGARLIHISTDNVFGGEKGMYTEADEARPINYYGLTKLRAEQEAQEATDRAVVLRVAHVYGAARGFSSNALEDEINKIASGKRIRLYTDQIRTPVLVSDIAKAISSILAREDVTGIFHIAGPDKVNRYELCCIAARVFGLNADLIEPVTVDEAPTPVKRPRDLSLIIEKARAAFDYTPLPLPKGIATMRIIGPAD